MFGKRHRFHGYGSLKSVYSRGQTARGQQISLKFTQRDPHKPYRAAVVVSRKTSKSAVVRNRIRRRIYEEVRRHDRAIKPGTDLVFTVYSEEVATMPAGQLAKTIADLISRV